MKDNKLLQRKWKATCSPEILTLHNNVLRMEFSSPGVGQQLMPGLGCFEHLLGRKQSYTVICPGANTNSAPSVKLSSGWHFSDLRSSPVVAPHNPYLPWQDFYNTLHLKVGILKWGLKFTFLKLYSMEALSEICVYLIKEKREEGRWKTPSKHLPTGYIGYRCAEVNALSIKWSINVISPPVHVSCTS